MTDINRQIVPRRRPVGEPTLEDFEGLLRGANFGKLRVKL